MSEPFLAEIRLFGFNFAPRGWALCDGQILPISQNPALYSLLGTSYGGDGRNSFALPDLRGRAALHFDNVHRQGAKGGSENHQLNVAEIPAHSHAMQASSQQASADAANNNVLSKANIYTTPDSSMVQLKACMSPTGGSRAHENRQPYLAVNFCIALQGQFPSRN
ncbi:MAG: phage tail protein [Methyloprofundus sp.]|nr:phage tail protein [Methyloprofundus sp.]